MSRSMKSARLKELDSLRGFAALSVVIYHFTTGYSDLIGWREGNLFLRFNFVRAGIAVFFVISGFVIFYSLQNVRKPLDFLLSRISRLIPPYYAAMSITIFIITVGPFNFRHVGLLDIPANLIMAAPIFKSATIDGPYWTLTREILFYFTISIFYFIIGRDRVLYCLMGWLLLSISLNMYLEIENYYWITGVGSAIMLVTNGQFSYLFVIGIVLYKIWSGDRSVVVMVTLALALVASGFSEWPSHHHFSLANLGSTLAYTATVAMTVIWRPSVLRWPVLVWFGTISYSLYLIHETLGFYVIHVLQSKNVDANICVAVACASVIAVAALLQRFVEVPGRAWVMQRYRSMQVKT